MASAAVVKWFLLCPLFSERCYQRLRAGPLNLKQFLLVACLGPIIFLCPAKFAASWAGAHKNAHMDLQCKRAASCR